MNNEQKEQMIKTNAFDEFQFLNYLGKSKANINDLFKTENEE